MKRVYVYLEKFTSRCEKKHINGNKNRNKRITSRVEWNILRRN